MKSLVALGSVLTVLLIVASARPAWGAETLNGHAVVRDGEGKLVSWVSPQEEAYDRVMGLAWNFLLTSVPAGPNGLKPYYSHSYVDPRTLAPADWPHNPAGLYAMLTQSALAYYAYSGNGAVVALARELVDYHLAHGMTPADWLWPRVPFASADSGSTEYRGAQFGDANGRGDGFGVIEPDKVGELGYAFLLLYQFTGEARYRDAALSAADALARQVRAGDAVRSPWPFRVHAQTGVVREEYTAHVIAPIRLFDELIRLGLGDVSAYGSARRQAWAWLMAYPMRNDAWSNYFEDVPIHTDTTNYNQLVALETARYILQHPDLDPDWRIHVPHILAWVERTFGREEFGATTIAEQIAFSQVMGSHTARYASVNALWFELTGDVTARETAYRAFNWATYMCGPEGRVIDGPHVNQIWWTDGYGDYIRHFMAGLGAVPEWSPWGRTHLLRSTSVVRGVSYQADGLTYETYDGDATEVLRLGFTPSRVTAGGRELPSRTDLSAPGWTFDPATGVLRVHHEGATHVEVRGSGAVGGGQPAPPAATTRPVTSPPASPAPWPASTPTAVTQTVTFDDRAGQNQALDGRYPAGVIDWGVGAWWHSGPWGGFATKSVSFTDGRTSAGLSFLTPRRLVRLEAYNGGRDVATVTLDCAGQPSVPVSLAAGQVATIETHWIGTCTTMTIGSTNGWDTNFDNLVLDSGPDGGRMQPSFLRCAGSGERGYRPVDGPRFWSD